MKVRISRDELLTGLQRVQGVVEKRNTVPILSNILLEAKSDGVDILATDLEIGMRGLYKATVEEPGSVTVSARKVYEILKELRDGEIELTVSENKWTTIRAGKSQFKIVGLPSSEYPQMPAIDRESLTPLAGAGLIDLIRKTLFAVGDNDARYILNGLLIMLLASEKKATLRLVGTDGHRLAVAEQDISASMPKDAPKEMKAIIPKKAAHEIRRLLEEGGDGEPLIGFTKNLMIFRKSGLLLTSRLMEGNYPNYQQVLPKESNKRIAVNRNELEGALRRVSVLSRDKANAVKLSFAPGRMTLFSSN